MRISAQVEMQSVALLERHKADRPSFEVLRRNLLTGNRAFRVFAMPSGLLFLEVRTKPGTGHSGAPKAAIIGGVLGGAVGAVIGGIIDSNSAPTPERETGFDMLDEDQLIDLARRRKRSFVSKYDEIKSVALDAPGGLGRLLGERSLAGWLSLHDKVLGKLTVEFRDPAEMAVAVDSLPRRLGDRLRMNVKLDEASARFVPVRR
jgi:hypothetical protein